MSDHDEKRAKLAAAIAALDAQRTLLGDAVVDPAVLGLRQQLRELDHSADETAQVEERKLVTVLFADIAGFTALSEQLDPEDARALINACFEALVPVVQKYGGSVDKFIGDEIMAVFGAPIAHEDDPERALRTALEMMEAIAAFNRAHKTKLELHLGINTGLVVAGKIGGQNRSDYSVMGDAVNLAARLEDASSEGQIFVGPATYRLTNRTFEFDRVAAMVMKGKAAPVEVHRLIGLKAAPHQSRGIEGLNAALVGRDRELATVREALAALGRGEGSVLALIGEAGLGKSRLLAEGRALLPPKIRWVEGRALSFTVGMSYSFAREIVLSLLGISGERPVSEIAEALRGSLDERKHAQLFPYLASILALPLTDAEAEALKFLSAEALQTRILAAVRDYVRTCAELQPHVLVWEDLHWCDPSSKRVFEMLLPLTRAVPLLILSAARPAEDGGAAGQDEAGYLGHTLRLSPLTRDESGALIRDLLRIENLPEQMRELILSRAEGNPFFLEELLRSLIDAGAVAITDSRATATEEIVSIQIPETVQGVLAARIDRLQSKQKQTLQLASVIGRVFQQHVLARLSEKSAGARILLAEILRQLQERQFIQSREQHASETAALEKDEYIFKHAITHDVAYGSMLLARRKELHQLVAETMEALFSDRLDELSAKLGYHFERAENAERAAFYLTRAAQRAQATFANAEAIGLYRSAIAASKRLRESTDDPAHRSSAARLNENLADVLVLTGAQEDARVALGAALSLVSANDKIARSRLSRKIGFSHSQQRHFEDTARAYDRADAELGYDEERRSAGWWEEKLQIQLERMHLLYWRGEADEMRQLAGRVRRSVERHAQPIQRGRFFQMLSLSLLTRSRYQPSEECLHLAELAVTESEGSANLSEACHVRFTLGFAHLWRGNFGPSVAHLQGALRLAERVGDLVLEARCLTYLAVGYRCSGNISETISYSKRTADLAQKIGMPEYVAMAKASRAWAHWREREIAEAEREARIALDLWHAMEDPYSVDWMALLPLIAISLERADLGVAIEHARGLFLEEQHPLPENLASPLRHAIDCWTSGNSKAAQKAMNAAMEIAHQNGRLRH